MPRSLHRQFPLHGWSGLLLIALFWPLNWLLEGLRTHWGFFPLWLGYCLAVDGLNVRRTGRSLWMRGRGAYLSLFLISAPLWAGTRLVRRIGSGAAVARSPGRWLAAGLTMLALLLIWPRVFFPFVWLSLFFVFDSVNQWRGTRSITDWTGRGDWRPAIALGAGALTCGFFWELWNVYSYPKWVYSIPWFDVWHVFEMPLAGYLGYPPFALELFAAVHLVLGLFGRGRSDYVTRGLVA